jgi:hypothetical protein
LLIVIISLAVGQFFQRLWEHFTHGDGYAFLFVHKSTLLYNLEIMAHQFKGFEPSSIGQRDSIHL